jgi:hypothetical protein
MEIIPSNRGDSKLCYQGYMYTKHATRKTNRWWKCVKRSSTGCRGSLSTTLQNENLFLGSHTIMLPVIQASSTQKPEISWKTWQPTPETNPARSLPRLYPNVTTMSKPCCPVKKTANAQFDNSVQLLQSQPPMLMSDCLRSTQQLPTTNSSCNTTTARMQKTEC